MTADAIVRNFDEIRRKSIKVWTSLKPEFFSWRPDNNAFSCLEMVRHVLETEHVYHVIVNNRGGHGNSTTPWTNRLLNNVHDELTFAEPFRQDFMKAIKEFSHDELSSIQIVRSERITRSLGDFLLRCNYHESVHLGQLLSYLRAAGLERPNIWD